jgi:hypothetical protein
MARHHFLFSKRMASAQFSECFLYAFFVSTRDERSSGFDNVLVVAGVPFIDNNVTGQHVNFLNVLEQDANVVGG